MVGRGRPIFSISAAIKPEYDIMTRKRNKLKGITLYWQESAIRTVDEVYTPIDVVDDERVNIHTRAVPGCDLVS